MKSRAIPIAIASLALMLFAQSVFADERVEVLERRLQERDRVIRELLERVEALEQRVGAERLRRSTSAKKESLPTEPTPVTADSTPGLVVVDEHDAERALDRSLTRQGALLLPSGVFELEPSLGYRRREGSTPSIVSSGGTLFAGRIDSSSDNLSARLALRLGLPSNTQLEIDLPYEWRRLASVTSVGPAPASASRESGSGNGDLRVGVAKTLLREGIGRPDLIARLAWNSGNGRANDGAVPLAGGFEGFEGSLTAIKRRDPVALIAGISYERLRAEDHLRPGATVGARLGGLIALSPETSLSIGFAAAHQRETELDGLAVDGSDRTIGTLLLGGSTLLAPGKLLNLTLGVGLTEDADKFSFSVSLPLRPRRSLF